MRYITSFSLSFDVPQASKNLPCFVSWHFSPVLARPENQDLTSRHTVNLTSLIFLLLLPGWDQRQGVVVVTRFEIPSDLAPSSSSVELPPGTAQPNSAAWWKSIMKFKLFNDTRGLWALELAKIMLGRLQQRFRGEDRKWPHFYTESVIDDRWEGFGGRGDLQIRT